MVVTAWILLIIFGYFSFVGLFNYMTSGISLRYFVAIIFTTIVSACCAGYLFG